MSINILVLWYIFYMCWQCCVCLMTELKNNKIMYTEISCGMLLWYESGFVLFSLFIMFADKSVPVH